MYTFLLNNFPINTGKTVWNPANWHTIHFAEFISEINLNKYVIYISCVLEYVDKLPKILSYLNKVNKKDIFIVTVEWYSLNAYFYPYYLTNEQPPKNIIYLKNNKIKYFSNLFY